MTIAGMSHVAFGAASTLTPEQLLLMELGKGDDLRAMVFNVAHAFALTKQKKGISRANAGEATQVMAEKINDITNERLSIEAETVAKGAEFAAKVKDTTAQINQMLGGQNEILGAVQGLAETTEATLHNEDFQHATEVIGHFITAAAATTQSRRPGESTGAYLMRVLGEIFGLAQQTHVLDQIPVAFDGAGKIAGSAVKAGKACCMVL